MISFFEYFYIKHISMIFHDFSLFLDIANHWQGCTRPHKAKSLFSDTTPLLYCLIYCCLCRLVAHGLVDVHSLYSLVAQPPVVVYSAAGVLKIPQLIIKLASRHSFLLHKPLHSCPTTCQPAILVL